MFAQDRYVPVLQIYIDCVLFNSTSHSHHINENDCEHVIAIFVKWDAPTERKRENDIIWYLGYSSIECHPIKMSNRQWTKSIHLEIFYFLLFLAFHSIGCIRTASPRSKFHTTFFAGLCVSDKHQKLLHFEHDFSFNVTLFLCFSRRASQTKTVSYLMESFAKFFGISKKWELRGVKKQLSNENETDRLRSYFHFLFLVCK